MLFRALVPCLWMAAFVTDLGAQSSETYEIIFSVKDLRPNRVEKLERRLRKKPTDRKARIQLLSYYTRVLVKSDPEKAARGRAPHLLWMVEHTPDDDALDYTYIAAVNSRGNSLPDPELHRLVEERWAEHARDPQATYAVLTHAAVFLSVENPAAAALLYQRVPSDSLPGGTSRFAGLCVDATLGLSGFNHLNTEATWANLALRDTEFAAQCRLQATTGSDALFLGELARLYYRVAGPAYAGQLLKEDYTKFGAPLLERARKLSPTRFELQFVPNERLPQPGEPIPMTVRVGGPQMSQKLVHRVKPLYPPDALRQDIEGQVELDIAVGLDGSVVAVGVENGHPALWKAAEEAIRQWVYKPTTVNGNPVYVVTKVVVTFTASRSL